MPIPGLDDGRRHPIVYCMNCGARKDSAWSPSDFRDTPNEGDLSVCLRCGFTSIYTGNGIESRKPTPEEMDEIVQNPHYQEVQAGLRELWRTR